MRSIIVKSVEIFSDGSINFLSNTFKTPKQVILYEKDFQNSIFSKKIKKKHQQYKNVSSTLYKLKYKL